MPAGIIATVDDGYATIDFVDQTKRAKGLADLLEAGGPGSIETITRDGPRRKYRVPAQFANTAGLLDGDETGRVWSAGADTGAAQALDDADPNDLLARIIVTATGGNWKYTYAGQATAALPAATTTDVSLAAAIVALSNVAPGEVTVTSPVAKTYIVKHTKRGKVSVASDTGTPLTGGTVALTTADEDADWHTPVDQYTSANSYVGRVPNADVLHNRGQVYTGDASSYGGRGNAPLHSELVDLANSLKAPGGGGVGFMSTFAETGGDAGPEAEMRVGHLNAGFASMDGALGTDPGAVQADPDSAAAINGGLANQTGGLGTDPGSTPDVGGGGVVAEDFTTVQSTRTEAEVVSVQEITSQGEPVTVPEAPAPAPVTEADGAPRPEGLPEGDPTTDWKRAELDAYAVWKGIDPTQYSNKADLFNALPKE